MRKQETPKDPEGDEVGPREAATWRGAGSHYDSVVFAFGTLAQYMLRAAFARSEVRAAYSEWLHSPKQGDNRLDLMHVASDSGCVRLQTRPEPNQFVVFIQHRDFRTSGLAVFDPRTHQVDAVWLENFWGPALTALEWMLDVRSAVAEQESAQCPEPCFAGWPPSSDPTPTN